MYQSMNDLLAQPGASGHNADFRSSFGILYTNHDVSDDLDENITTMENSKYRNYSSFSYSSNSKYNMLPYCSWDQFLPFFRIVRKVFQIYVLNKISRTSTL